METELNNFRKSYLKGEVSISDYFNRVKIMMESERRGDWYDALKSYLLDIKPEYILKDNYKEIEDYFINLTLSHEDEIIRKLAIRILSKCHVNSFIEKIYPHIIDVEKKTEMIIFTIEMRRILTGCCKYSNKYEKIEANKRLGYIHYKI